MNLNMLPQHSKVGINWQTLFIFIPGLNIWAAWRIQRLRRSLLFFLSVFFLVLIFFRWEISISEDMDSELMQYLVALFTFGIFIIGANFIIHYFRKWSRQWNENLKN